VCVFWRGDEDSIRLGQPRAQLGHERRRHGAFAVQIRIEVRQASELLFVERERHFGRRQGGDGS
jgi:hypothetical protein